MNARRAARLRDRVTGMSNDRTLLFVLAAGFVLRLLISPFGEYEYDTDVVRRRATRLADEPLAEFYAAREPADHLPGDMWLLWGLARLYRLSPRAPTSRATRFCC